MVVQINRLQLENFLSWKSLDWSPSHPIACLIGENDSGKSNLLRAFEFLAETTTRPLDEIFHTHRPFTHVATPGCTYFRIAIEGSHRSNGHDQDFSYELKVRQNFESGPVSAEHEKLSYNGDAIQRDESGFSTPEGSGWKKQARMRPNQTLLHMLANISAKPVKAIEILLNSPVRALIRDLSHLTTLRLNAGDIRAACEPDRPLMPSGRNLAASLDTISSNPEFRPAFESIERRVQALLPRVRSIGVKSFRDQDGVSKRVLKFGSESAGKPFYFEADAASDGMLYLLALVVFSQAPDGAGVSLLEEPEIGLHPHLLESFVHQLREVAANQQVIMTSHSPMLLDSLSPEEVWITTRDSQGFSTLTGMAAYPDLDRWRDNFNTGEIWMNVAEGQLAATE